MKKALILFTFLTISFASYSKSNEIQVVESKDSKEIKLPKISNPDQVIDAYFNYYEFEVTTSCGVVRSVVQFCDCTPSQLVGMAYQVGTDINLQYCPFDEPGSQHVRIFLPLS